MKKAKQYINSIHLTHINSEEEFIRRIDGISRSWTQIFTFPPTSDDYKNVLFQIKRNLIGNEFGNLYTAFTKLFPMETSRSIACKLLLEVFKLLNPNGGPQNDLEINKYLRQLENLDEDTEMTDVIEIDDDDNCVERDVNIALTLKNQTVRCINILFERRKKIGNVVFIIYMMQLTRIETYPNIYFFNTFFPSFTKSDNIFYILEDYRTKKSTFIGIKGLLRNYSENIKEIAARGKEGMKPSKQGAIPFDDIKTTFYEASGDQIDRSFVNAFYEICFTDKGIDALETCLPEKVFLGQGKYAYHDKLKAEWKSKALFQKMMGSSDSLPKNSSTLGLFGMGGKKQTPVKKSKRDVASNNVSNRLNFVLGLSKNNPINGLF